MVEQARERYGDNVVTHGQKESLFTRICKAFINPFTAILFVLAAVRLLQISGWLIRVKKTPLL
mgnify:FL=1